jgi:Tol biopolymer transport system component
MTAPLRFDQDLPILIDDVYVTGTPDYRDDLVRRIAATRQRPAWTFPGRWLPMELTTQAVPGPRMPWRTLGVLALIGILLAAVAIAYVGSPQRLPAPFGPAANGSVAYASGGDLFVADVAGGEARRKTSSLDVDLSPMFSPDGERLAFLRSTASGSFVLMVMPAGGGPAVAVSSPPLSTTSIVDWAPDGQWLLVGTDDRSLLRIDADGQAEPIVLAKDALLAPFASAFRPPDGRQIMFLRESTDGLWVMDSDGANAHVLIDNPSPESRDFRSARWSPDGSQIAFTATVGDGEQYRIHLSDADGQGIRRLSVADGPLVEADLRWSPDGRRIAYNQWAKQADGSWQVQPVAIIDVGTGVASAMDVVGSSDGTLFDWSPDGTALVAIPGASADRSTSTSGEASIVDVKTGAETSFASAVQTAPSWQRRAP